MDLFRLEIVSETQESTTVALFGHMQRLHVAELEVLLKDHSTRKTHVTLDLGSLQLLDREAACYLGRLCGTGVTLRNCSAFVSRWVNQCGAATS
ncbi:MAG: hypothetical protein IT168_18340 [Bryobacterales bacterium]|nr:hypothetical protein [Bryobacterales bacterium]